MLRKIVTTSLVAFSLPIVGCSLMYDFEKDSSSAAGADAGGQSNKGGAAGSKTVNAGAGNANVNGGAANSRGGNAASTTATASGNAAGIANSSVGSGGSPATTQATTTTPGGVPGTSGGTPGATTAQGGVSGTVTSPIVGGTTAQGGVGQAGTQSAKGGSTPGGAATGGTTAQQGGAAGKGGTATSTGGVVTSTGGTTTVTGGTTATGGVATGGVATGGVATGGTIVAGDTTPPTVTGISPTNGTTGVQSTTPIRIVFSEPMNQSTVTSALSVSSFASGQLAFSWSSDGKQLTITPSGGLQYATGTSPAATAATYLVALGTGAKDLAGNGLSSAFSASFSTLRRITQTIPAETVASFGSYAYSMGDSPIMCGGTDEMKVGYYVGLAMSESTKGFVRFDTSPLPLANTITVLESASFVGTQLAPDGDFYASSDVSIVRLVDQAIDKTVRAAPTLTVLGVWSSSAAVAKPSYLFTNEFMTEFAKGTPRQLFSLNPGEYTARNTWARFQCGGFTLEVTYLIP